jgi:TonB family protein
MANLLLYLVKVSAGTTLLYLCYLLLFRKDTFYLRNRILLILILVLPTFFPLIKIPVVRNNIVSQGLTNTVVNFVYSGTSAVPTLPGASDSFDYIGIFTVIYFVVAALLLIRILVSLISTYRIIRQGTINRSHFPKVIISEKQLSPFSFFPYAVIPAEDYRSGNYKDVLDHEFAHLRQGHSFDLLLTELFISFQWFNPFVWLIKRSVILNHEYLADQLSLINNNSAKEYQYRLLNFQKGLKNISLAHNFNSLIKNRIIMINKKPTRRYATLKNILILPVVAIVVYAFSTPEYHSSIASSNDNSLIINQQAAIHQKEAKGKDIKETSRNGAAEINSTKNTNRPAIQIPVKRTGPDDYPTFQGKTYVLFNEWVVKQIKYPAEAAARGSKGRISANVTIEADGSISNVFIMGKADPDLSEAIISAIRSSPRWEKAKNPKADGPFQTMVSVKFELPDKVSVDDAYIQVEQMPQYPGGDAELLKFISRNIKYPETARSNKIQGRVIIRFIVNKEGNVEEPTILRGVDPLLDAEAIRAVSMLKGFSPGLQGGKPVNVYFMVPVTFSLATPQPLFSQNSQTEILKFMGMNTGYPQAARSSADTGKIFIVVKMGKSGIVKECKAYTEKTEINIPFLPEVVIVGFKPQGPGDIKTGNAKGNGHPDLQTEGLRIANKLGSLNIPEWKDKDMEFALTLKFVLK